MSPSYTTSGEQSPASALIPDVSAAALCPADGPSDDDGWGWGRHVRTPASRRLRSLPSSARDDELRTSGADRDDAPVSSLLPAAAAARPAEHDARRADGQRRCHGD